VRVLTFNNFRWKRASETVLSLVRPAQELGKPLPGGRQPLIVAYGHSWGGGSIRKLALELAKQDLEISLAIYIDTFQWRNPRLPPNIRYAVNFYQRTGVLRGLPLRGKSRLIPEDPARTQVLGNYEVKPLTEHSGWSWNLLQPLLYRHHHRIAHDLRLQAYLLEIINVKLEVLNRFEAGGTAAAPGLFDRVVLLGASVSAGEKAPSPGWLLARHMGTPESAIHTFAEGGAPSSRHLGLLDNIAQLRPTLIIALDLFFHDFQASLFLTDSRRQQVHDYIRRLHDTGAVVLLGNIPNLVLLRHEHVNRYLASLTEEFPRLLLMDVRSLFERAEKGFPVAGCGEETALHRSDLFADRLHPNLLGSTLMANLLWERLREEYPDRLPETGPLALPCGDTAR
jgi:hypothetical protein